MCALPKLRPAPFFCHEKAHMHSKLLYKQQKGQRLSEIPHRVSNKYEVAYKLLSLPPGLGEKRS